MEYINLIGLIFALAAVGLALRAYRESRDDHRLFTYALENAKDLGIQFIRDKRGRPISLIIRASLHDSAKVTESIGEKRA